jgi:DNA ligase (NAD+)
MSQIELEGIEDVGPRIAESIVDYFAAPVNRENIERLRAAGVQMEMVRDESQPTSDILAGKSIVISGVFAQHSRDEYKAIIEQNGGKNVGSISKKTDFVLAGENMGPAKLEKAQKLGIPILSEADFLTLLNPA